MRDSNGAVAWGRIAALALPILYSCYPVVALLAQNIQELPAAKAGRALLYAILGSVSLLLALWLLIRDWGKASLVCAAALVVFFSYGHVYAILKTLSVGGVVIGRHRYLLPLCLAVLVAWCWIVLRSLKRINTAIAFFGIAGVASLIIPLSTIAAFQIGNPPAAPATETATPMAQPASETRLPDIYYIVLDGYAREDVLRDLYGLDNSEFLAFLEGKGFYVVDDARSNYMQTLLSFASSLNMRYLDDVAASTGEASDDRGPLSNLMNASAVRETLAARGYRLVFFGSGYGSATIFDADVYLAPGEAEQPKLLYWSFNEFEGLLLSSTMVRVLIDGRSLVDPSCASSPLEGEYLKHRDRVLYTLDRLEQIPEWEGTYFVFAHLISPHPPFVFGPNGETLCHSSAYSLLDASHLQTSREDYIKGYRDQLTYLNKLLSNTLTQILRKSDPAPIIILQADHGPGAYTDWLSSERSNIRERLGILNAYYFPGGDGGLLYESISPVNSFRVVFNLTFGGKYELLSDESYFSTWERPYDFVRVTERVDSD